MPNLLDPTTSDLINFRCDCINHSFNICCIIIPIKISWLHTNFEGVKTNFWELFCSVNNVKTSAVFTWQNVKIWCYYAFTFSCNLCSVIAMKFHECKQKQTFVAYELCGPYELNHIISIIRLFRALQVFGLRWMNVVLKTTEVNQVYFNEGANEVNTTSLKRLEGGKLVIHFFFVCKLRLWRYQKLQEIYIWLMSQDWKLI